MKNQICFCVIVVCLGLLQCLVAWPVLSDWPDSLAVFLTANFCGVFGGALLTLYRPLTMIAGSLVRCSVGVFSVLLGLLFLQFVVWGLSSCTGRSSVFEAAFLCLSFGGPSLVVGWLAHRRLRALRQRDLEKA